MTERLNDLLHRHAIHTFPYPFALHMILHSNDLLDLLLEVHENHILKRFVHLHHNHINQMGNNERKHT